MSFEPAPDHAAQPKDAPAGDAVSGAASAAKDAASTAAGDAKGRAAGLSQQAGDRALALVDQGKDRATGLLEQVSKMLTDAADQVDERLGQQYGQYARTAAGSVQGFADQLRDKQPDDLVGDLRTLVRQSPGVAIGAAAALGFVVARLVTAGLDQHDA